MKILLLFLQIWIIQICIGQSSLSLKKNTVLHYIVENDNGSKYTFDITIDKFGATGIKFDWLMKLDKDKKGTVTIYKAALETATAYRNYFGDKTTVKLTKESTVWMSKKNYEELLSKKKSTLSLDFSMQQFVFTAEKNYATVIGTKKITLKSFLVKSTTTENNITILKDANNPLILRMQPKDFVIYLKSIEQK